MKIPLPGRLFQAVPVTGSRHHLQRLLLGSLWNGTALLFTQGSTFLGTLAAVRLLDRDAFGAYVAALATVQFGSAILSIGLGGVAMKYISELRETEPDRAGRFLGFGLAASWGTAVAGSALLLALAPLLAERVFNRPALEPLLRLAAPAMLFAAANLGLGAILTGLAAFRLLGRLGAWGGIGYLLFIVAGLLSMGERGAVLGIGAAAVFQFSLGTWLVVGEARRQGIRIRLGLATADRRLWRNFTLPSALMGVTGPSALWLIQVAIVRSPDGLVALGSYVMAGNLMTIVLLLPNVVYGVSAALLNERRGAADAKGFEGLFRDNLRITMIAVLSGLVVVGFGGPALLTIFGHGYRASYPVLLVLLGATLPESLTIALNQLLQARAQMWRAFLWIGLPRDVLMPAVAYVLAPRDGAMGGAVGYLSGRLLAATCMVLLVRASGVAYASVPARGSING